MKKNKAFSNQIAHIHKSVKVVVDPTIKVRKIQVIEKWRIKTLIICRLLDYNM